MGIFLSYVEYWHDVKLFTYQQISITYVDIWCNDVIGLYGDLNQNFSN